MRFIKSDLERIAHIKELITTDLSCHISIRDLAKQAGLNERKLHEGFKRQYKQTIFGYLKQQRINLARTLLKETDLPVTEIASRAGYNHPENFTHAFKSYTGMTPLLFRKSDQ